MVLSKRLRNIVDLVAEKRIIDVGCDHGKVVLELFLQDKIDYAICSDISLPSVTKAEVLLKENNIPKDKYSIRCGNGLQTLTCSDNIDTAIIAGMGGKEIINILNHADILPHILILQPQKNAMEVKKYILDYNYHIIFDKIVKDDDKFYNVIKADRRDNRQVREEYRLYFGLDNFKDRSKDFGDYLAYLKQKYTILLTKVKDSNRQTFENMLLLIERAIKEYRSCNL